jgi:hypothetical protein
MNISQIAGAQLLLHSWRNQHKAHTAAVEADKEKTN